MENINEVDFEIVKEFINLPIDAMAEFFKSNMENEVNVSIVETAISPAVNAGVQDGVIGVDVELSGSITGHTVYFISEADCEKLMTLKKKNVFDGVEDDDKYEMIISGARDFANEVSIELARIYHMLLETDITVVNSGSFSIPSASDFYSETFEVDEQVVVISGEITANDGQSVAYRQIIPMDLTKSIIDVFYNSDVKLPSQMPSLGESVSDSGVTVSKDAFVSGNDDMSGFIDNELDKMMPDPQVDFSASQDFPAQTVKETPMADRVEHIPAPRGGNLDLIMSVPVEVSVEVGRTKKRIKEILDFKRGTLVELDRTAGEAMDIFVNGKCIAKGEVVVIEDKFGVRITKIMKTDNIFD